MAIVTTHPPGLPTWARSRKLGEYGLSLDKYNDGDERPVPYSWTWYLEMRSMRGSAYSKESTGLVHTENLAIARGQQAITRASARLAYNSTPGTSYNKLEYWVNVLRVPERTQDTREQLRQRCAAKFMAAVGPTEQNENDAIESLLGNHLVDIWRQTGADLDNPPTQTYWPGINPGPVSHSLGGGAWLSERSHLVVEVQQLHGESLGEFLELMNVHLFSLLDIMTPAWCTFNWATNVATGFLLDISDMDFDGFNP